MTALDDLLHDIFDGRDATLYLEFAAWVRDSRRYRAFAGEHRAKIRAKLKNAGGEDGLKDLRAELETAALLLREDRFTLQYEKYAAAKSRGPDFTVTYKTHTPFNVEVRRIRGGEWDEAGPEAREAKLTAVLADKVGQMPPSIVNLLWLTAESPIAEADLTGATATLLHLAERKVEETFTRRGFESAAGFLKAYGRLSGIAVRRAGEGVLWLNPVARHKVPREIAAAVGRILSQQG